jgi:hypothetical protein
VFIVAAAHLLQETSKFAFVSCFGINAHSLHAVHVLINYDQFLLFDALAMNLAQGWQHLD